MTRPDIRTALADGSGLTCPNAPGEKIAIVIRTTSPILVVTDEWRVCWLGGWDKCRVFFVVMVCQLRQTP
jgi:hypothetical protein